MGLTGESRGPGWAPNAGPRRAELHSHVGPPRPVLDLQTDLWLFVLDLLDNGWLFVLDFMDNRCLRGMRPHRRAVWGVGKGVCWG